MRFDVKTETTVFRLIHNRQTVNFEPLTFCYFVLFSRATQMLQFIVTLIVIGSHSYSMAQGNKPPTFESDVLPVFNAKCIACHSGQMPQAQLDLQTKPSIIAGGEAGQAAVMGSSAHRLLVGKVVSGSMPPGGDELTSAEIALIRLWVDKGAPAQGELKHRALKQCPEIPENEVTPIF